MRKTRCSFACLLVLVLAWSLPAFAAADEPIACEKNPLARQFDFWIGDWNVLVASGSQAGTNSIQKTVNGCMLLENWTSSKGGVGKSMNFYDAGLGRWIQIWIDGKGGVMRYEGAFEKGAMRLKGKQVHPDGSVELFTMVFTPNADGSVRQYIESSKDGGKTWKPWFDGKYVRQ